MTDLRVAPCSHTAAKLAVERWHYSGSLPTPPLVPFGVWQSSDFIGAVIFGRGATPDLFTPYGLDQTEGCELVRVALRDHDAPVSQIVAEALRNLRVQSPGVRLVVSFADPAEGHHGGIYQAGNWIYTGTSSPSTVYYDKAGRKWHGRQVSATGIKRQYGELRAVPKLSTLRRVSMPGKHRYLMPLDRAMRRQVTKLAQPYPQSADQVSMGDVQPTGRKGQVRSLRSAPLAEASA